MRQLESRHILLFRILRDHCSFLTRRQVQRILTLPANSTNKQLAWLMTAKYLSRRYRADTFAHSQAPVYYLGKLGWHVVGKPMEEYKGYRLRIERRSERQMEHSLLVYDVFLKFLLEATVKRVVDGEDPLWHEAIDFGNVPDGWIQFSGGEAFIEVDRETEFPVVMRKKFENYEAFKKSGRYASLFPNCSFKVLVLTLTETRIEMLEKAVPSDDIWFCTLDDFTKDPLEQPHWFALHGFYALPIAGTKEM